MQIEELKELIHVPRLNYQHLKTVYDYLQKNPGATTVQIGRDTGLGNNAYRYRDLLLGSSLINNHNVPIKSTVNRLSKYEWPSHIIEGNNITNNVVVNLAALIARFNDDDEIPGFQGRTRKQLTERFAAWVLEDQDRADKFITDGILQSLAIASLATNNLEAFTNMINVRPVGPELLTHFKLKGQD